MTGERVLEPVRVTPSAWPEGVVVPAPRREIDFPAVEPDDQLDVRVHAPTPEAVIVWAAGPLHQCGSPLMTTRVRQQLRRAPHVVLDLSSVTWMDPRVAGAVRALQVSADRCGTTLHIAAEDDAVVERLRRAAPGRPVVVGSADAVLAGLAARGSGSRPASR